MANHRFFDEIFPNYWEELDRSGLIPDEQSMFGDSQVFDWIIDTVKPVSLVEVGSWKGHSANYMINRCKSHGLQSRIVCVDTFLGGPEHWILPGAIETLHRDQMGRPTILPRFLGNVVSQGNENMLFPLTADSTAGAQILRHFEFKADLIFIDAAHDPESVIKDVMGYYQCLASDGVMFGDDYQYEPLAAAVHDCARRLGVQVIVSARKWVFLTDALMRRLSLPGMQIRSSFEGWVHS